MAGRPLDTLEAALEELVAVELKDGTTHEGILAGYDQHLNVVLEPPEAAVEGGDAVDNTTVIRGDNVVTIQP